jgi:arginase
MSLKPSSPAFAEIIRAPLSLGAEPHEGLKLGPMAVERLARKRIEELQLDAAPGHTQTPLRHNLTPFSEDAGIPAPEAVASHRTAAYQSVKNLDEVAAFCAQLRDRVLQTIANNNSLPIVLGGDHSIAIGTVAGVAAAHKDLTLGVIWIDSHADFNTGYYGEEIPPKEYRSAHDNDDAPAAKSRKGTTLSGNIHGMPLRVITGEGDEKLRGVFLDSQKIAPNRAAAIGLRDIDREERDAVARAGVHGYSARRVGYAGIPAVLQSAIANLKTAGVDAVHISFDIDAIDAPFVPGIGTRVPGGLTFREADLLVKLLRDWLPAQGIAITSFELVEVNALKDHEQQTVELAARLLCAFLGEEILADDQMPFPHEQP